MYKHFSLLEGWVEVNTPDIRQFKYFNPRQTSANFSSFSIINSLGQKVRDGHFINHVANIRTTDLAPGLYEIHFQIQLGTVTKKFVKTD